MANHVHATLKELLSLQPVELRTIATAEELLRKNWRRYRLGFHNEDDELKWAEKALTQLRAFIKTQDVDAHPIMMEEMVEAEISTGLVLRGRIDRVDKQTDGSLHIIDYKTGNTIGEIDWEQVELHALILSKRLAWQVSKISYLYLANSAMQSAPISNDYLNQVHWRTLATANKILREKQFPPNRSPWCRNCDFISICPGKSKAEPSVTALDQLEFWDDLEMNNDS